MNLNRGLASVIYRFIFTMLSMIIIIPMVEADNPLSVFIASCTYAFGRLPDYIDAIQYRDGNWILQVGGLFIGLVILMTGFYSISRLSLANVTMSDTPVCITVFAIIALAVIDLIILIFYIQKDRYTKKVIEQDIIGKEV